jgi:hypothetical protein
MINPEEITPTVHCNGNSKNSLLEEWYNFGSKLSAVIESFPHESFHARNHYVRSDVAPKGCRIAQGELQRQLQSIKNLSESVIEKIQEQ